MDENISRSDSTDPEIIIIPIRMQSHDSSGEDSVLRESRAIRDVLSGSDPSDDTLSVEDQLARSTLSFHSVSSDPEDTVSSIEMTSGVTADESLVHAARCGAFWRSVGAETLIYMSSYGGGILANGLLIRFAGLDPIAGTLLLGSFSALSYHSAQVLFTSLLEPPKDEIPEDRQTTYDRLNQYAFLPVSWVVGSLASGTALSLIGDTDFGTQQAVSVPASILIGPVTTSLRTLTRECLGGSIEIRPDGERPQTTGEAFETAFSDRPNPLDDGRSHRYGMVRNSFVRLLGMSASSLAFFAYNGQTLSTYCIGDQEAFINATETNTTADINDLLNAHCAAGQFTFALREFGLAVTYGVGILVVEPILNGLVNRVYDYFYPQEGPGHTEDPLVTEVSSDDTDV